MTPSGMEPATFRGLAQCLEQLAQSIPLFLGAFTNILKGTVSVFICLSVGVTLLPHATSRLGLDGFS